MADDVVLIGGQAWSFWAELFEQCSAELAQGAPYTSKDIDFFGSAEHVERCANLLGAQHKLYGPEDMSICTGIVITNEGFELDFVHTPRGVPPNEVKRRSVAVGWLRVMHPIHVLISRAANVVHIPRTDDHALQQLRACL